MCQSYIANGYNPLDISTRVCLPKRLSFCHIQSDHFDVLFFQNIFYQITNVLFESAMKHYRVLFAIFLLLCASKGLECATNGTRPVLPRASITITEHSANPPVAANCTPVTLTCQLDIEEDVEVDVWWTFRGENATKLPNVTIETNPAEGIWKLYLLCPTVEHDGSYDCNAHSRSETQLVYRKETTVEVYVPTSIEVGQNETSEELNKKVNLTCHGYGYPQTSMNWYKDGEPLEPEEGRLDIEVTSLSKEVLFGIVMIHNIVREDNGTYDCEITSKYNTSIGTQDMLVLERPEVTVDSVQPLDSRTALLKWHVRYRSNSPVKHFHLQVKNFSTGVDWLDVDDKIPPNATNYTVRYLAPAMTYGFQLAAVNDLGSSKWEVMNVTMPADVPPKVSWVHVLASTNETLLFGWRRPTHDNGANIINYEVKLTKSGQIFTNGTLNVTQIGRNNHMYVFVNLEPGEPYSFQVQACSKLGCGNWSDPLEAVTSDGFADPPENVEVKCIHDPDQNLNFIYISWSVPKNSRGTLQGFNISLEGQTRYRNMNGNIVVEQSKNFIDVKGKDLSSKSTVIPNTNYTVRVCTVNKAGCGLQSAITNKTMCASPPSVPTNVPQFKLEKLKKDKDCTQLKLELSRISERNGLIWCYHVIVIKLKKGDTVMDLPSDPKHMNISTYGEVHKNDKSGAYIAEAFTSDNFRKEVIIGDKQNSQCISHEDTETTTEPEIRKKRNTATIQPPVGMEYVYDGELSHNTNYTGYLEVRVWGPNGTMLSKQSPYFSPTQTGSLPSPVPAESPFAFVFGVVCGVLVVLVLVLVLCLVRRKSGHPYEEGERFGLTALIRRTVHRNGHLPRGKGNHLSKLPRVGPVSADDLPAAFMERHMDNDLLFQSEFEALPEKHKDRTTHASDSPDNILKNRYPDIKAYDQTRVRLPVIEGIPGSDYINANFVKGYKGRKTFICAQGPLERTVFDFWRMIWEHKVCVIVMLTGIEEHGKIKCSQYWSDDEPKIIEETFNVAVVSTKKYSDYIVRRLQVKYIKDEDSKDEREILHFHFMMWKDFLAPEQPSWLLRFIKRVNEHYSADRGPLLVHCSAGVGRTGTFVAIDSLLQQLEDEGQVDIYIYICSLRKQRNFLVQSLKQYIFVYRALMEHAQFGDTEIEMHHLRDHYELLKERISNDDDRLGLEVEFEKLGEVIEDHKASCVGTMAMNMSKNRYDFIIPYDVNRVILPPSPSRDHSSYINASFIQGYDRSLSFIITQDPLACTISEFWRIIKEQSVATVVMLSDMGEGQTKCQQYWPDLNEEREYDYVKVKAVATEESTYFVRREFIIGNIKSDDSHKVTHMQFCGWTNPVPEDVTGFLSLVEAAQQCQEQNPGAGPLTVHCSGGGDRSSVFVTLTVLIQQLKAEERVDVFQAARYTRSQRCCMLQTLAQYDFLYRGLLEYIISHKLCDLGDTQL